MIGSLVPLVVICGAAALAEVAALRALLWARPPSWLVENYRGATVVGRGGVSLAAPLGAGAVIAAVSSATPARQPVQLYAAVAATVLFGLLGWLDDAHGSPGVRGLKGHLAHLVNHRRVTTGLVKAAVGSVVGLWGGYLLGAPGWAVLPAGAVTALSANSLNALDTRPGRAGKAFVFLAALILALGFGRVLDSSLIVLSALLGGVVVFLAADLSERAMLGDTGANALGCALGLAVVSLTDWPVWVALSVLLFLLCLAADRWSISRVIESAAVLRWADQLGRSHKPPPQGANGN